VQSGGLISYAPSLLAMQQRVAKYADSAKPGDLPVEQPTKFELVINLKAAKALGLTTADEVIE
jgi:putative tryptophan/tyrosine transport system substrate-binding protein